MPVGYIRSPLTSPSLLPKRSTEDGAECVSRCVSGSGSSSLDRLGSPDPSGSGSLGPLPLDPGPSHAHSRPSRTAPPPEPLAAASSPRSRPALHLDSLSLSLSPPLPTHALARSSAPPSHIGHSTGADDRGLDDFASACAAYQKARSEYLSKPRCCSRSRPPSARPSSISAVCKSCARRDVERAKLAAYRAQSAMAHYATSSYATSSTRTASPSPSPIDGANRSGGSTKAPHGFGLMASVAGHSNSAPSGSQVRDSRTDVIVETSGRGAAAATARASDARQAQPSPAVSVASTSGARSVASSVPPHSRPPLLRAWSATPTTASSTATHLKHSVIRRNSHTSKHRSLGLRRPSAPFHDTDTDSESLATQPPRPLSLTSVATTKVPLRGPFSGRVRPSSASDGGMRRVLSPTLSDTGPRPFASGLVRPPTPDDTEEVVVNPYSFLAQHAREFSHLHDRDDPGRQSFLAQHAREFAHLHNVDVDGRTRESFLRDQGSAIAEAKFERLADYIHATEIQRRRMEEHGRRQSQSSSCHSPGVLSPTLSRGSGEALRRLSLVQRPRTNTPDGSIHRHTMSAAAALPPRPSSVATMARSSIDTILTEDDPGLDEWLGIRPSIASPPSATGTPELTNVSSREPTESLGSPETSSNKHTPTGMLSPLNLERQRNGSLSVHSLRSTSPSPSPSILSARNRFSGDSYDIAQSRYYDERFHRESEDNEECSGVRTRHKRVVALAETMRLLDGSSSRTSKIDDSSEGYLMELAKLGGFADEASAQIASLKPRPRTAAQGLELRFNNLPSPTYKSAPNSAVPRSATSTSAAGSNAGRLRAKAPLGILRAREQQRNSVHGSFKSVQSASSSLLAQGAELMTAKPWMKAGSAGGDHDINPDHGQDHDPHNEYPSHDDHDDKNDRTNELKEPNLGKAANIAKKKRNSSPSFENAYVSTSAWYAGPTEGISSGFGQGREGGLGATGARLHLDPALGWATRAGPAPAATDRAATASCGPRPTPTLAALYAAEAGGRARGQSERQTLQSQHPTAPSRHYQTCSSSTPSTRYSQTRDRRAHAGAFWTSLANFSVPWKQRTRKTPTQSQNPMPCEPQAASAPAPVHGQAPVTPQPPNTKPATGMAWVSAATAKVKAKAHNMAKRTTTTKTPSLPQPTRPRPKERPPTLPPLQTLQPLWTASELQLGRDSQDQTTSPQEPCEPHPQALLDAFELQPPAPLAEPDQALRRARRHLRPPPILVGRAGRSGYEVYDAPDSAVSAHTAASFPHSVDSGHSFMGLHTTHSRSPSSATFTPSLVHSSASHSHSHAHPHDALSPATPNYTLSPTTPATVLMTPRTPVEEPLAGHFDHPGYPPYPPSAGYSGGSLLGYRDTLYDRTPTFDEDAQHEPTASEHPEYAPAANTVKAKHPRRLRAQESLARIAFWRR